MGNAVLKNDRGYADRVEPGGGFFAGDVDDQDGISSAGTNEDGGAGVYVLRRAAKEDFGIRDVGEADGAAAGDEGVLRSGGILLGAGSGASAGRAVWPERDGLGGGGGEGEKGGEDEAAHGCVNMISFGGGRRDSARRAKGEPCEWVCNGFRG